MMGLHCDSDVYTPRYCGQHGAEDARARHHRCTYQFTTHPIPTPTPFPHPSHYHAHHRLTHTEMNTHLAVTAACGDKAVEEGGIGALVARPVRRAFNVQPQRAVRLWSLMRFEEHNRKTNHGKTVSHTWRRIILGGSERGCTPASVRYLMRAFIWSAPLAPLGSGNM